MTQIPTNCPLLAYNLAFKSYIVETDYECVEAKNRIKHIISYYRYEHPDALVARDHAVEKVLDIKRQMELGSNDPDFRYDLTGLEFGLEFTAEPNDEDQTDFTMQHRILDGESVKADGLIKNLTIERCLLKRMGFDLEGDDQLLRIVAIIK